MNAKSFLIICIVAVTGALSGCIENMDYVWSGTFRSNFSPLTLDEENPSTTFSDRSEYTLYFGNIVETPTGWELDNDSDIIGLIIQSADDSEVVLTLPLGRKEDGPLADLLKYSSDSDAISNLTVHPHQSGLNYSIDIVASRNSSAKNKYRLAVFFYSPYSANLMGFILGSKK